MLQRSIQKSSEAKVCMKSTLRQTARQAITETYHRELELIAEQMTVKFFGNDLKFMN